MNNVSLTFQMLGAGPGTIPMSTPSKTDYAFNFISLVNLTDNFVSLIGNQNPLPIIRLGAYSAITLPMQSSLYENISLAWTNPSGSDLDTTKQGLVIYSSDNIGINQAFSPGFNIGGIGANVNATVIADTVGLARQAQLPAGLDGAGNLKISNQGSPTLYAGTLAVTNAAAALAASQPCTEVLCQADPANTNNILIGNVGTQPILLYPGVCIAIPVANIALLYAKTSGGAANLNYLARS
jgi:hypothetical protein